MNSESSEKTAKKRGKPFTKGASGNPKGRKPLPADIKAARVLATEEMLRTVIDVRRMTAGQVRKLDLEKVPLGKKAIISAYAKNDYRGIKDYEDRLFGKAQETITLEGGLEIIVGAPEKPDDAEDE